MEESVDSDVLLVVPSSIEDSDPTGFATSTGDNLLGISTKPLDPESSSFSVEVGKESFSCFQLSGRDTQNSQSESSESLRIDESDNIDIIPPSPKLLHIDLSDTPSANISSTAERSSSPVYHSCGNSDMDSGRMSPDLIGSSEVSSSAEMISSNPDICAEPLTNQPTPASLEFSSAKLPPSTTGKSEEDSTSPHFKPNLANPYEADTETYSLTKYPPPINLDEPDSMKFFRACVAQHTCPSPVLLTASTVTDSEMSENSTKIVDQSLLITHKENTVPVKLNVAPENGKMSEEYDLDSKDIIIEDVNMRKVEDDEVTGKEIEEETSQVNVTSMQNEGVETQEFTQDLNLHLTLESQLFESSSFHTADGSQCLTIDEEAQPVTQNFKKQEAMTSIKSNTIEGNLADENDIAVAKVTVDSDDVISSNDEKRHDDNHNRTSVLEKDSDHRVADNALMKNGQDYSQNRHISQESDKLQSSHTLDSMLQMYSQQDDLNPVLSEEIVTQHASVKVSSAVELEEHVPASSGSGSIGKSQASKSSPISDHQPILDSSVSLEIGSENTNSLSISSPNIPSSNRSPSLPEHKNDKNSSKLSISDQKDVNSDSREKLASSSNKSVGSQDLSPSMQSTYIDENNNPSQTTQVQDVSMETIDGSLPIQTGESFDGSVEYSSLEKDEEEFQSLQFGDLETQPFSLTPLKDSEVASQGTDAASKASRLPIRPDELQSTTSTTQQSQLLLPNADHDVVSVIKNILNGIIDAVENRTIVPSTRPLSDEQSQHMNLTCPDSHNEINRQNGLIDKRFTPTTKDSAVTKVFEYRSQTQPSQEIQLKSQFLSPTSRVRRSSRQRGKSKKQTSEDKSSQREMDNNNNDASNNKDNAAEEHDKSSDTLPLDDNSDNSQGPDSDPLTSPARVVLGQILYKVTRHAVVETIVNGEVVETKTFHKRPKYYKTDPYQQTSSSQSSNGSGYLADTSSISRTSSDSSTQTNLCHSPGLRTRRTSHDPVPLHTELSGGSSSSSGSSSVFLIPGSSVHPPKSKSLREHHNLSPDPKSSEKSAVTSNSSSTSGSNASLSPLKPTSTISFNASTSPISGGASPSLKEGRVVLTPLSTKLISCQIGEMGDKNNGDVATPPTTTGINPPLSGSTPMTLSQKEESSDITTSNSPEIPFPSDSLHGTDMTSFPFDDSSKDVDQSKESLSSPPRLAISEGIPVLARPARECYYYPGLLRKQDPESGKYTVFFEDDGNDRQIRETDILLIDMLPVGQEVYAQSDSDNAKDWYSAGTVAGYWRENDKRGYFVNKSSTGKNETKGYTRRQVIVKNENLSRDLKKLKIQPISGLTTADVSLDNIMDGKRRSRRLKAGDSTASSPGSSRAGTPSPKTPRTPRSSRKRRADSESSGSSSCVPFPTAKKSKRGKLSYGSPRTTAKRQAVSTPIKTPITYKESTIFEKCGFLLTSTTGKDHPSSEFDSPPCTNVYGYDREVLKKQIIAGNGIVVRDFTQLMSCDRSDLYVISDNYCRTMNYFNALAAGISCVSYLWINDSTKSRILKPIQAYLLPAGYSLQHQGCVERPSCHTQPLSGIKVSLQMKDPSTWNPLLCIAGCISVSTRKDASKTDCPLSSCDVVIADSSCNQVIRDRADKLKIPVVSIEWVIQCLINNKKLPFDGHFQYNRFT